MEREPPKGGIQKVCDDIADNPLPGYGRALPILA
jgi:hypothetical protein